MAMKNPPHVGGVIRREVIEPLGLTVTEAAKALVWPLAEILCGDKSYSKGHFKKS